MQINIHQAKTNFSQIIQKVINGEEIIIAKAGKPIAKLIPIQEVKNRVPGLAKRKIKIQGDFNEPLPEEIEASFYK